MNLTGPKLEQLETFVQSKMPALGFSHFGFAPLTRPFSFEMYQNWLNEGLHGEMHYLQTHAAVKENPQSKWSEAKSALVFAVPYLPHPESAPQFPLRQARVSLYAQGYDYHYWFKNRMQFLCDELKIKYPSEEFIPMTDSSPVLERDLAYRAGLGWVAKNTCLIHPKKGSLFFIGEIYSSIALTSKGSPLFDACGNCTRCIDICPTGAIVEPRKLDARKCISYLTIESREVPPVELREKTGDWFFGCDLCQTVCPWNEKIFKGQLQTGLKLEKNSVDEDALEKELRWILITSGKQLEKSFFGTPLARAGSFGLKRNAMLVANNRKMKVLTPEIKAFVDHPKLGELAQWVLQNLDPA